MNTRYTLGHKLLVENALLPVAQQRWRCECGNWEGVAPDRGPFNSTSTRARLGVVITAHGRHLKAAKIKASKAS